MGFRRITIQRATVTKDANFADVNTWTDYVEIGADLNQVRSSLGRQEEYNDRRSSTINEVVEAILPYTAMTVTITTDDRVVLSGTNYNIITVDLGGFGRDAITLILRRE